MIQIRRLLGLWGIGWWTLSSRTLQWLEHGFLLMVSLEPGSPTNPTSFIVTVFPLNLKSQKYDTGECISFYHIPSKFTTDESNYSAITFQGLLTSILSHMYYLCIYIIHASHTYMCNYTHMANTYLSGCIIDNSMHKGSTHTNTHPSMNLYLHDIKRE